MYYNNKKLALSIFWIALGAVLFALSVAEVLDSTVYAGMGGALMGVGALQAARNIIYRRNEQVRERLDIELTDERSRFVRQKAWAWAGYLSILIEAVGGVIAMIIGQDLISHILLYCVALQVLLYWVSYLVCNRKY